MNTDIRIRAFRAIDDPDTCLKFIEGHRRVLSIYGIENVTTNTDDWMYNPAIFCVVVETLDGEKLYGGARVQVADGKTPLPIEEATGDMDPKIHEIVKYYSQFGIGELSGLWNSKEVAGLGIGSLFPSRVALAITDQIGVNVIITLCSPTTVRFKDWIGGRIVEDLGNKGTFYYPKIDLLATVLINTDTLHLSTAHPREREKIMSLREDPFQVAQEKSPFKAHYVSVHYALRVVSANPTEFKLTPTVFKNPLSDTPNR